MTEGVCHPAARLAQKFESLAGVVWEVAEHGALEQELCFCMRASTVFPHALYRVPACHEYCSRLMDLRESRRRENLTERGEQFLSDLEASEFTEPGQGMKGECQLYWETLITRELLRRIEGNDQWPENERFRQSTAR
jgi:hypothetical protein